MYAITARRVPATLTDKTVIHDVELTDGKDTLYIACPSEAAADMLLKAMKEIAYICVE